jgi:hypothetical protein
VCLRVFVSKERFNFELKRGDGFELHPQLLFVSNNRGTVQIPVPLSLKKYLLHNNAHPKVCSINYTGGNVVTSMAFAGTFIVIRWCKENVISGTFHWPQSIPPG